MASEKRGNNAESRSGKLIRELIATGMQGHPPQHGITLEMATKTAVIGTEHAIDVLRAIVKSGYAVKVPIGSRRAFWCAPEHAQACAQYAASCRDKRDEWYSQQAEMMRKAGLLPSSEDMLLESVSKSKDGMDIEQACKCVQINSRQTRKRLAELVNKGKLIRLRFGKRDKSLWCVESNKVNSEARIAKWLEDWAKQHRASYDRKRERKNEAERRKRERERLAIKSQAELDAEIDPPMVRKWTRATSTYRGGKLPPNSVWQWGQ